MACVSWRSRRSMIVSHTRVPHGRSAFLRHSTPFRYWALQSWDGIHCAPVLAYTRTGMWSSSGPSSLGLVICSCSNLWVRVRLSRSAHGAVSPGSHLRCRADSSASTLVRRDGARFVPVGPRGWSSALHKPMRGVIVNSLIPCPHRCAMVYIGILSCPLGR